MQLLKKTSKYFLKYIPIYIVCILLGLMRMVIMLVEPQVISLMVDRVIGPAMGQKPVKNSSIFSGFIEGIPDEQYMKIFAVLVLIFIATMVLYFVAFYLRWNIAHLYGLKSENQMRQDAFQKINREGNKILSKYTSGELITISGTDPARIKDFYMATIPFMIDCIFYIVTAACFLAYISRILLIFPLLIGVVYILLTKRYIKQMGRYYGELWEKNTALNTLVQESIYGVRIIKSAAKEKYFSKKFNEANGNLKDFYYRFGDFGAKYEAIYSTVQSIFYVVCMAVGIVLAVNLKMTSGEFVSFLAYLLTISWQFISINFILGDIQDEIVSGKRFFEFMELPKCQKLEFGEQVLAGEPSIEVVNLTIKKDEHNVLEEINISLPYGKKIGIMGNSGSGKSVLLKTLQGLTDYEEGQILINGAEMHTYTEDSVGQIYSYAMQNVFLFSNTIASNIAYYNPQTSQERIAECAKAACANEFIERMSGGYEAIIGEKGFGLSGGQKQRIAIARALCKNAPVLILDDCTSALDAETEHQAFAHISKFYAGRTQLIATHRAYAVVDADEILFMEQGRIVERGTHQELLELNGKYAAIYRRQSGEVVANG